MKRPFFASFQWPVIAPRTTQDSILIYLWHHFLFRNSMKRTQHRRNFLYITYEYIYNSNYVYTLRIMYFGTRQFWVQMASEKTPCRNFHGRFSADNEPNLRTVFTRPIISSHCAITKGYVSLNAVITKTVFRNWDRVTRQPL